MACLCWLPADPNAGKRRALSRNLSAEFATKGVRSVVLRSSGLPETKTIDVVFGLHAQTLEISSNQFRGFVEMMTHRKRSSTLAEVASAAVFAASDAGGIAGAFVGFHLLALVVPSVGAGVVLIGAVVGAAVFLWGWRSIKL